MYLKSIEVHGFKSFANKIDFQFHNGITAIVGPNGSGKSNVADAVRWVLGEQSARQLRGSSMQDVIFAGTQARKPMGFASVSITLDNSDHQLTTDYEEVTVTRRVYRSGESEYLINGTAVRLKDINELFYDTGIGKEGYSIIGQGQIDRILSGKPEDRRELFDEAAGIVKFKRRKAETIKKLNEAEGILTRVNDILSELEKQVEPLEKQSAKARIYLKKKDELKRYEVNAFLVECDQLDSKLGEAEKKKDVADSDLGEAKQQFEAAKAEFDEMDAARTALEETINAKQQELLESSVKKQKLEGEAALLLQQIEMARSGQEQLKVRCEKLEEDIRGKNGELSDISKRKKAVDEKAREAIENREDGKESVQALSENIRKLSSDIEKNRQYLVDSMGLKNDIASRISKCDASIEQINIRRAGLNSRLLKARSEEEEMENQKRIFEEDFKKICARLTELDAEIAGIHAKIGEVTEGIRAAERDKSEAEKNYHELRSKLESMRNLAERYEGYSPAIRRIMEQKDPGVYGVVADILKVDKKYETAIETALGGNIQNIVVKDEQTAKDMIEFLKRNRLGRATFLPLTMVREREFNAPDALKEKGALGLADTLVTLDEKYRSIASHLLHNYIVSDNIDNAISMAKKFNQTLRIVTLKGDAINPGGSISGGAFKNNSNLLGRKREMEELEKQVKAAAEEIRKADKKLNDLRDKRTAKREEAAALSEKQQQTFIQQNTAKMNLNQISQKQEAMKQGYASLHDEESSIAEELAGVESDKVKASKELESFERSETDVKKKLEEQSRVLEERQKREADILAKLNELEVEAAALEQNQKFEEANLERVNRELETMKGELSELRDQMARTGEDNEQKKKDVESIKLTIEAAGKAEKELETFIEEAVKQKSEMDEKQRGFITQREKLSERVNSLTVERERLDGIIAKFRESNSAQYSYMWNEYEITMQDARAMRDESLDNLSAMKKEIMSIKNSIRELGNVNVNAIEEYKELMERYEFMSGQREDSMNAKASLEKIIAELDEGMRKLFTEKFSQIAQQFNKVFKEMFGGGTGTLELLDDEDILETGIRIVAQPPGKKLQNMMQLSGGEMALTAIALLFAIQNLKPSPFCLLDEIEAALDESNVGRFASYLKKLTRSTQFIVISHRRGTMERADRLYGITMQEKGVSALVSVDLIDDKVIN